MSLFWRTAWLVALAALLLTGVAYGQDVVSAQAGLINYIEGQVTLDGKDVVRKPGLYPQVKENGVLKTGEGRAELLLNPGAFLRMSKNSSLRMITTRLIDTRVEVLGGSVLLECAGISKNNAVALVYKDSTVTLRKKGLYRLDAEPPCFSVLDGEAVVATSGQQMTLKTGKRTGLTGVYVAEKFNAKAGDALYGWSRRRSEYLAQANVSMARVFRSGGRKLPLSIIPGGWVWNWWMDLYTYVPSSGSFCSPFGWCYYSPGTVWEVSRPQQQSGGSDWRSGWTQRELGYSTVQQTSAGTSGVLASSTSETPSSSTSSSPPPSSVSRDTGHAGGTGR